MVVRGAKGIKKTLKKLKIPIAYAKPLQLFKKFELKPVLFKQTPFRNHEIGGLDVLFGSLLDYSKAINYLKQKGYVEYLTEKNEPYKTMMVKFEPKENMLLVLHLQRKIAWYGVEVASAKKITKRAKIYKAYPGVYLPCYEDILLIHAGHILFENYKVHGYEQSIFKHIQKKGKQCNQGNLKRQLRRYGWEKICYALVKRITNKKTIKRPYRLPTPVVLKANLKKFFAHHFLRNVFFLAKQCLQYATKRLSLRKKGTLVVFCGVNGSGKSTMTQKTLEQYTHLEEKLNLPKDTYYFGWKPLFPLTKLISFFTTRNGKSIYAEAVKQEVNKEQPKPKPTLLQELMFAYLFFEYAFRYYMHIYPRLRKRSLVVCDRYFYHVYGQYPYAPQSKCLSLLLKGFPQPDALFLLQPKLKVLKKRRKDVTPEHLAGQQQRYQLLIDQFPEFSIIKDKNINKIISLITKKTWQKRFEKLRY